ncbi:ATP-binding cassette domain-containing protein [Paracoccus caeni]|uniref:Cell division ATP-binding protein FtsE n=1 Tax=Paracoccus caeni TaxID=657651 RepID=A0A934SGX7_9RHOB|nr:methionine ABC transporter ATP-binding protein [Paracoccus caeni]MBK4216851.1 ATP-binding cassette domain-containing protein [Paracoccus caeni]
MISLRNVFRIFDDGTTAVRAVSDVDLDISNGDVFGIIGYSGAGKSTLIRLLNGLERPTSGSVRVNGVEIGTATEAQLRRIRPRIGMIFQHFNLLWSRTVRGNIALPMVIAGVPKAEIAARTEELIRLVGLEGREEAWPSQLSGGQKQRVGIARALANNPEVLLCDEATSALDPDTTDQILDLLSDINRRLGLTIVLITHEMHVVRRICSHVAVMEQGHIVETGPVSQVFANPEQPVTQRFLRQLPATGNDGARKLSVIVPQGREADLLRLVHDLQLVLTPTPGRDADNGQARFDLTLDDAHPDPEPILARLQDSGLTLAEG